MIRVTVKRHCETCQFKFQQVGGIIDTGWMVFNPICALANKICDGLGGLLDLSNSPTQIIRLFMRLFWWVKRLDSANTMDLAGIIHFFYPVHYWLELGVLI